MDKEYYFESGKSYSLNTSKNYRIHIERRTDHYVTFTGDFAGKKKIYHGLSNSEYIWIPSEIKGMQYLTLAKNEA